MKTAIATVTANDNKLREGIAKNHKRTQKVVLGGKEVTYGEIIDMLEERDAKARALDAARRTHRHAVADYRGIIAATDDLLERFLVRLVSDVGETSPDLGAYGIAPKKDRAKPSAETRAEAARKAAATRKARHTMGKKERLAVVADDAPAASPAPVTAPPNASAGSNGASNGASNGMTNGVAR
jgi:hypothetical protein